MRVAISISSFFKGNNSWGIRSSGVQEFRSSGAGTRDFGWLVFDVVIYELPAEIRKCPVFQGGSDATRQVKVEMEIVDCDEAQPKYLFSLNQMADVTTRKRLASRALADFFDRSFVQPIRAILQVHCAEFGERGAVSRKSSWKNAIKHVNSARNHFHNLSGCSQSHDIAWLVSRQEPLAGLDGQHHLGFGFANADASDSVPVKIHSDQGLRALFPEIAIRASLDDAEEQRSPVRGLPRDPFSASLCPLQSPFQTRCRISPLARVWKAFVKRHRDIRPQNGLNFHRNFGI
jgi:hypothetical protein